MFKMLWSSFKSPEAPNASVVSDEERRTAKKLCYGILYRQVCRLIVCHSDIYIFMTFSISDLLVMISVVCFCFA